MSSPICPVCKCAESGVFFPKAERELWICQDCRHIFWDFMPDTQTLASFYANQYTGVHQQQTIQQEHRAYYRSHIDELASVAGTAVTDLAIADVGCSYPVFLEEAATAGATTVIGVDWSDEARTYGAARGIPVITPEEMLEQVPDGSLDVLRYSHTLEHLIDPVGTLRDQIRKLRQGGIVYITQPNIPVFRFALSTTDIHDSVWPTHLHFFSPISLIRMCEAAGLTVQRFFSVTDPDTAWERYGAAVDLDYATKHLATVARKGEKQRGELNNYPYYLGLNSAIYLCNGDEVAVPKNDITASLRQRLVEAERRGGIARTMVRLLMAIPRKVTAQPSAPCPVAEEPVAEEPEKAHGPDIEPLQETLQKIADMALDSLAIAVHSGQVVQPPQLTIRTDHPVAFSSADHVHPRGTANDSTRHPRFVAACERQFPKPLTHLDLGCAGGGLVWDFLLAGHHSYGIEGSDYSRLNRRDFWRVIPRQLFTADVLEPFALLDAAGTRQTFHVITAWEVLEHLPEERLPQFFDNVRQSLRPDGIFVASIATFPDEDPASGVVWHVTVQPRKWWLALFARYGLQPFEAGFNVLDFVRGSGNPRAKDWDVRRNPEMGFHVVLRHSV